LGTVGYNADAAAALNDSLGQQSDPWRQRQAQQKLSTLSHWLQQLHQTKISAAQMWLTDLLRPSTHCQALQFAQKSGLTSLTPFSVLRML